MAAHGIPYQEDETNADTHYARNCLRREIWPMLQGINPQAGRHVAAAARILTAEGAEALEAALETDLDYLEELGYACVKSRHYKTSKHLFLKRIGD